MSISGKNGKISRWIYSFAGTFLGVMMCLFTVFVFFGRTAVISGNSMEPNLHDGETVLLRSCFYSPDYGDVIAVGRADRADASFVKRVVAKGGDEIDIDFDTHLITVNGGVITEHYKVVDALTVQGDLTYPVRVPEGCVFVLGDNRNDSLDSRFSEIGFIRLEEIAGKAVCRLFSFDPIK